jgi:hypothetical protein
VGIKHFFQKILVLNIWQSSISNQAEMKTPAPLTKSLITEGFKINQEILTVTAFKMHNFSSLSARE